MKNHSSILTKLLLVVTGGLLAVATASAVTFGPIKIKSTVGQPLRAEVEILTLTQEEARDLHVKLASQNEHLRLGFDWRALMSTISVEIVPGSAGARPFVRIQSAMPVDFDKLGLALIAESSVGRVRREFIAEVPHATGGFGGSDTMRMLAIR